jgi:predicted Zn-ribbon and HTH transcriptional regulator
VNDFLKERREICDSCERKGAVLGFDVCKECGCPLATKLQRLNSHCPLKKWLSISMPKKGEE